MLINYSVECESQSLSARQLINCILQTSSSDGRIPTCAWHLPLFRLLLIFFSKLNLVSLKLDLWSGTYSNREVRNRTRNFTVSQNYTTPLAVLTPPFAVLESHDVVRFDAL